MVNFKVGHVVRIKNKDSLSANWFKKGTENLEVESISGNNIRLYESDKSDSWYVNIKDIELICKLTKRQRDTKIKKIIDEINKNKEYVKCFEDVSKEVNSWDDIVIKEW